MGFSQKSSILSSIDVLSLAVSTSMFQPYDRLYGTGTRGEVSHKATFRGTREFVLVSGYWQQAYIADTPTRCYHESLFEIHIAKGNYYNACVSVTISHVRFNDDGP